MPTQRLLPLLLALGLPWAAHASVVKGETIDEMIKGAPVIVHARVQQVQVVRDEAAGRIFTFAEVETLEALKGTPGARFIVRQSGGEVGGRGTFVAGAPRFEQGQEVVLFLEPARDDASFFLVRSLAAGKLDFEVNRLGETRLVRHLDGLAFAWPGAQNGVHRVGGDEDLGAPADFLAHVRQVLKGGAR